MWSVAALLKLPENCGLPLFPRRSMVNSSVINGGSRASSIAKAGRREIGPRVTPGVEQFISIFLHLCDMGLSQAYTKEIV